MIQSNDDLKTDENATIFIKSKQNRLQLNCEGLTPYIHLTYHDLRVVQ